MINNIITSAVPNIRFVFASVPNSGPNSLFVFGRIVRLKTNTNSNASVHHQGEARSVCWLIFSARKIVGHFRHLSSATSRLHEIQEELSLPKHQLKQDVVTRWNSTYHMLDRLLEQNRAITVFLAENDDKTSKGMSLTARQWTLVVARVVKMLKPFDQLTREVSQLCWCLLLDDSASHAGHLAVSTERYHWWRDKENDIGNNHLAQ